MPAKTDYKNSNLPLEARIDDLLGRMTLAEKIGQMTQVDRKHIEPGDIANYFIGSILNGGGGFPTPNEPKVWYDTIQALKEEALQTRLAIPLIYGVDAVHGHNNLVGATIFPHNIGLGATRDLNIVRQVGRATAVEMAATNIRWNFAPAVSVPRDIRWGRAFEGYSENTDLVTEMGLASLKGLQGDDLTEETAVLASIKHYLADGGTTFGSSNRIKQYNIVDSGDKTLELTGWAKEMKQLIDKGAWQLDQGNSHLDEETLRTIHLPPYIAAIAAGALNIMVSYSSWNGLKLHAHQYLLTDVLKGELGFSGFLVSDWEGINQLSDDYYECVTQSINAGLDMVMVPFNYIRFIEDLTHAVQVGDVSKSRIDDAVRRILRAKFALGLFEQPSSSFAPEKIGCAEHRAIAREAVRKSAVLLKNEAVLPLVKNWPQLFVAGVAAHDIGYQCGGWTIEWMGGKGPITPGTTILEGIQSSVSDDCDVIYQPDGDFGTDHAPRGIVVISEEPYAEGLGDRFDLPLQDDQVRVIQNIRAACDKLVVILLSGRPLIITDHIEQWDALIAGWLPGTEGNGISDLLFGDFPFTGRLSFTWPARMAQLPLGTKDEEPLFPFGYGLTV